MGSSGGIILGGTVPVADGTTGSAGSSLLAAPADHRHPRYHWAPTDHNLLAWTYDPALLGASTFTPSTAGRLEITRVHLSASANVANIVLFASAGGVSLTSGQCFAALFTAAGALVGTTADQAAAWATGGLKTMAISGGPVAATAGDHYIGVWYNGTTSPAWARASGVSTAITNVGLSAPDFRYATADTGLTTTPPDPLGAQTGAATAWWAALS